MGRKSIDLASETDPQWVHVILENFDEFLCDHANCERKASALAMCLVVKHPDRERIVPSLIALADAYQKGNPKPSRCELPVEPLSVDDATRLAEMLLGRGDRATKRFANRIGQESGGSPFFVWELAQHVQEDSSPAGASLELDEVIWTRVNRLPTETRLLLEVFAVAGRPMRLGFDDGCELALEGDDGPPILFEIHRLPGPLQIATRVPPGEMAHYVELAVDGTPLDEPVRTLQPGSRVVVVEDVVTTGQSTIKAIERAREAGLEVVQVVALVDREEDNGRQNILRHEVSFEALFTIGQLMAIYRAETP